MSKVKKVEQNLRTSRAMFEHSWTKFREVLKAVTNFNKAEKNLQKSREKLRKVKQSLTKLNKVE